MTLVYELKKIKNIIYSYNTTKKQKAIDAKQKSIQKIWQNEELWLSLLCIYFLNYKQWRKRFYFIDNFLIKKMIGIQDFYN